MKQYEEDDPNRPETEEDGILAEQRRRMQVLRLSKVQPGQPRGLWTLQDLMPSKEASYIEDKAKTSL